MPPARLSDLKKVDLIIKTSEDGSQTMALVYQYEDSLWSVSLSAPGDPKKLLPDGALQMTKRLMVRNKTMEDCLFCLAHDVEAQEHKILKVSIDNSDKKGECEINNVYTNTTTKLVALEFDVENNDYMYYLDDEQRLVHIYIDPAEKVIEDYVYNLSVHSCAELIDDFDKNDSWGSILIDNRSVTI